MVLPEVVAPEKDAGAVASKTRALWQRTDAALSPVLGRRGVTALYQRSLALASHEYPELAPINAERFSSVDYALLAVVLAEQDSVRAAAASRWLFQTFRELLTELIGVALAEQLLDCSHDYISNSDPLKKERDSTGEEQHR